MTHRQFVWIGSEGWKDFTAEHKSVMSQQSLHKSVMSSIWSCDQEVFNPDWLIVYVNQTMVENKTTTDGYLRL